MTYAITPNFITLIITSDFKKVLMILLALLMVMSDVNNVETECLPGPGSLD